MKVRVQGLGMVTMLLRDVHGRRAVMRRDVGNRGGESIEEGAEVVLETSSHFVWVGTPRCDHCGVAFKLKLTSTEAPEYIELLPLPDAPASRPHVDDAGHWLLSVERERTMPGITQEPAVVRPTLGHRLPWCCTSPDSVRVALATFGPTPQIAAERYAERLGGRLVGASLQRAARP